MISKCHFPTD